MYLNFEKLMAGDCEVTKLEYPPLFRLYELEIKPEKKRSLWL